MFLPPNHSSRTFEKYSAPLAGITMQTEKENGVIIRGCTHPTVLYDKKLNKFYVEIWDTDNFICGSQSSNRLSFLRLVINSENNLTLNKSIIAS